MVEKTSRHPHAPLRSRHSLGLFKDGLPFTHRAIGLSELFTFAKQLDSWAMLHSHSLTWWEKTLLSRRFLFRYQNLRRTDGWVAKAFEIRTAQQSLSLSPALLVGLCLGRYLLG